MITPSFALTATERILPRMALDFTTASLDSRVTFTRSGNTATVVNSSGNVALINADLPRFDYDPTTLVCKGLLIEESRTNTIRNNTMAGAVAGSPGTNPNLWGYIIAGAGLTKTIVGTGTENGISYIDINISGTSTTTTPLVISFDIASAATGQNWTTSSYFKLASGSLGGVFLQIGIIELTSGGGFVTGANYTITNPTSASLITQRQSVNRLLNGGATVAQVQSTLNSGCTAGSVLDFTLRVGLPQMEQGAFSTSVIPTSVAQVTRNADNATMTGTNFSSWYNASEGAFVASSVLTRQASTGATAIFSANDNTGLNYINSFYRASGALGINIVTGGAVQLDQTPLGVTAANTVVNIGAAYKLNNSVSYANSTIQTPDTSVTIPTVTQLQLGIYPGGAYLNGIVRNLRYWPQRILNAEGQSFSK